MKNKQQLSPGHKFFSLFQALSFVCVLVIAQLANAQPAERCFYGSSSQDEEWRVNQVAAYEGQYRAFSTATLSNLTSSAFVPHSGGGTLSLEKTSEFQAPAQDAVTGFYYTYEGVLTARWSGLDDPGFAVYEAIYELKYDVSISVAWHIMEDGIKPFASNVSLSNPDNSIRRILNGGEQILTYDWDPLTTFSICEEAPSEALFKPVTEISNFFMRFKFRNPTFYVQEAELRFQLGTGVETPRGNFKFNLVPSEALALNEGEAKVNRGSARLLRTDGAIGPQKNGESLTDYRARIRNKVVAQYGDAIPITASSGDMVSFDSIPLFHSGAIGNAWAPRASFYVLEVRNAGVDELNIETPELNDRIRTYYAHSLLPDRVPQNPAVPEDVELLALDGLLAKKNLAEDIKGRSKEKRFDVTEDKVITHVNGLIAGVPSAENIEGVERAIWAERSVVHGLSYSNELIEIMLGGLGDLVTNLMEEIFDKFGTSAGVKAENQIMDDFKAERANALTSKGWKNFGNNVDVQKFQKALDKTLQTNPNLAFRHYLGLIKKGFKYSFALINGLIENNFTGEEKDILLTTSAAMKTGLFTMFDLFLTEGMGTYEAGAKLAVAKIIDSFKDDLYDGNDSFSMTAAMQPSLECSRQLMESWDSHNPADYINDRNAVATQLRLLGEDAGDALLEAEASKLKAEAFDGAENIFDYVKGNPYGRAAYWGSKILKFFYNVDTFGQPAWMLLKIRLAVEEAVQTAMSEGTCPSPTTLLQAQAAARQAQATPWNDKLIPAVTATAVKLDSALQGFAAELTDDDIPGALLAAGDTSPNVSDATASLYLALEMAQLQLDEIDPPSDAQSEAIQSMTEQAVVVHQQAADFTSEFATLLKRLINLDYNGPEDAYYIADRNALSVRVGSFRNSLTALQSVIDGVEAEFGTSMVVPILAVEAMSLTSNSTGKRAITGSPESFTLTAVVRNLSTKSLDNTGAKLTLTSPGGGADLDTPLAVSIGTLAADDGVAGGVDETEVSWQVTFNGSLLEPENITLLVSLTEGGGATTSFSASEGFDVLSFDFSLIDADYDGMPIDFELQNGLDPNSPDDGGDVDGDGLSNYRELELGTEVGVKDSDDDGLDDGEEMSAGMDGFLTDPLEKDTDGDGTNDKQDGHPLDGTTTSAPVEDLEPVVAVSTNSVVLDTDNRVVSVEVTNEGGGSFNWTARSLRPSVAVVSPDFETMKAGDGSVVISTPPGFDFVAGDGLATVIEVQDLGGADRDSQFISVKIGAGVSPSYVLSISVEGTGDGVASSQDAGINCGSDCQQTYAAASQVILQFIPEIGSTFQGWSGHPDCQAAPLLIVGNMHCVANVSDDDVVHYDGFE